MTDYAEVPDFYLLCPTAGGYPLGEERTSYLADIDPTRGRGGFMIRRRIVISITGPVIYLFWAVTLIAGAVLFHRFKGNMGLVMSHTG